MSKAIALKENQPLALMNMSVPQLTEACRMLDGCQERYDKLSGICATMRGFVLTEVKHKLDHGKFIPWLKSNFDKSRKTAADDMRLCREFSKCNPKVTFETLGRDLASTVKELEGAQLDLEHPLVREVATWVDGRSRYQLLLALPGFGAGLKGTKRKHTPAGDPNDPAEIASDIWKPAMNFLESDGVERRSWKDLRASDLERLRSVVADLHRLIKKKNT